MIWFLFVYKKKKKKNLDWSGGIEPRVEKVLKTDLTDWEESKKAKTFSVENWIFRSIEKQIQSIETWKTRKFWKLGNFLQNFKSRFYDMKCMSMIPNVFKNTFSSTKSILFIYLLRFKKFFLKNFYPTPKSIKHFKKHNFGWPQ